MFPPSRQPYALAGCREQHAPLKQNKNMKHIQSVTYLVHTVGVYGYYARGDSLLLAAQNLLKTGAKKRDIIAVVVVLGDPKAFIDTFGYINYGGAEAPEAWYIPAMITGTLGSLLKANSGVRK